METHDMILEKTYPDGTMEWICPICGRIIMLNSENMEVVISGDVMASHRGSTGGLQISGIKITEQAE